MSKKILVAYFSASGQTARLAGTIAQAANVDLFEICPAEKYTLADLNWHDKNSRSSMEMADESARPQISGKVENMDGYDVVFVGFPIWWYVAPRIIQTFLESYDFSGKTVIPFATSGSSGMGKTDEVLKKSCPDSTKWKTGKRFSCAESLSAIKAWMDGLDL